MVMGGGSHPTIVIRDPSWSFQSWIIFLSSTPGQLFIFGFETRFEVFVLVAVVIMLMMSNTTLRVHPSNYEWQMISDATLRLSNSKMGYDVTSNKEYSQDMNNKYQTGSPSHTGEIPSAHGLHEEVRSAAYNAVHQDALDIPQGGDRKTNDAVQLSRELQSITNNSANSFDVGELSQRLQALKARMTGNSSRDRPRPIQSSREKHQYEGTEHTRSLRSQRLLEMSLTLREISQQVLEKEERICRLTREEVPYDIHKRETCLDPPCRDINDPPGYELKTAASKMDFIQTVKSFDELNDHGVSTSNSPTLRRKHNNRETSNSFRNALLEHRSKSFPKDSNRPISIVDTDPPGEDPQVEASVVDYLNNEISFRIRSQAIDDCQGISLSISECDESVEVVLVDAAGSESFYNGFSGGIPVTIYSSAPPSIDDSPKTHFDSSPTRTCRTRMKVDVNVMDDTVTSTTDYSLSDDGFDDLHWTADPGQEVIDQADDSKRSKPSAFERLLRRSEAQSKEKSWVAQERAWESAQKIHRIIPTGPSLSHKNGATLSADVRKCQLDKILAKRAGIPPKRQEQPSPQGGLSNQSSSGGRSGEQSPNSGFYDSADCKATPRLIAPRERRPDGDDNFRKAKTLEQSKAPPKSIVEATKKRRSGGGEGNGTRGDRARIEKMKNRPSRGGPSEGPRGRKKVTTASVPRDLPGNDTTKRQGPPVPRRRRRANL